MPLSQPQIDAFEFMYKHCKIMHEGDIDMPDFRKRVERDRDWSSEIDWDAALKEIDPKKKRRGLRAFYQSQAKEDAENEDEGDAIQKKTFTKWANKHLKNFGFDKSENSAPSSPFVFAGIRPTQASTVSDGPTSSVLTADRNISIDELSQQLGQSSILTPKSVHTTPQCSPAKIGRRNPARTAKRGMAPASGTPQKRDDDIMDVEMSTPDSCLSKANGHRQSGMDIADPADVPSKSGGFAEAGEPSKTIGAKTRKRALDAEDDDSLRALKRRANEHEEIIAETNGDLHTLTELQLNTKTEELKLARSDLDAVQMMKTIEVGQAKARVASLEAQVAKLAERVSPPAVDIGRSSAGGGTGVATGAVGAPAGSIGEPTESVGLTTGAAGASTSADNANDTAEEKMWKNVDGSGRALFFLIRPKEQEEELGSHRYGRLLWEFARKYISTLKADHPAFDWSAFTSDHRSGNNYTAVNSTAQIFRKRTPDGWKLHLSMMFYAVELAKKLAKDLAPEDYGQILPLLK